MSEPTEPFPPRFWWLKRISVIFIVMSVGFWGALRWWRHVAERRMDHDVAQLRAAGEPVLLEDFIVADVPDADNAAISLKRAISGVTLGRRGDQTVGYLNASATVDSATLARLQALNTKCAATRSLARLARFQKQVNWQVPLISPVMLNFPNAYDQRQLTQLLTALAVYEHAQDHDAETVEILRDKLNQADLVNRLSPSVLTHLISCGCVGETAGAIEALCNDLSIQRDGHATTQPTSAASPAQIRALIDALLDERAFKDGFAWALQGERMAQRDMVMNFRGGPAPANALPQLLAPMYLLDTNRMMQQLSQIERAGACADYQAAKALIPPPPPTRSTALTGASRVFSSIILPSFRQVVYTHFRELAERRVAALRLAIRLYQLDHGGQFPEKLEELSPAYLMSLVADPFRADGKTFGYVRKASISPAPIIYSVGANGIDEGGAFTATTIARRWQWALPDVPFVIVRLAPTTQSIPNESTTGESTTGED